jgi:hypothetical protein
MIKELTQDLINKVIAVPAFENRVGTNVGGTLADPSMADAPVPFAWIVYGGSTPEGELGRPCMEVLYLFNVNVIIKYGNDQADLLNNQFPILEAVQQAVAGTEGPQASARTENWQYLGDNLEAVLENRMIYTMRFAIIGYQKTS